MRATTAIGGALVAGLLVVAAVVWLGVRTLGDADLFGLGRGEYTETGTTVVQSIRELSELTTVEMVEATTLEKGRDAGILNFVRGDRISLLAVARVGAGVDLSRIGDDDVELDREARSITLRLPPPEISYVALDNEATQVYDRDTGLLTRGDPQLESQARRRAEEILRQRALEAGILEQAEETTRTALTSFLTSLGFEHVEVLVESGAG